MMRLKNWIAGTVAIAVLAGGVILLFRARSEVPVSVRIIPSELSIGTERRLEPHLGLSSTAYFDVEVRGGPPAPAVPWRQRIQAWLQGDFSGPRQEPPAEIVVTFEKWEKGKRVEYSEESFMASYGSDQFVSISLKEEGKAYRIIMARRNSTMTTHAQVPALARPAQSSRKLEGPTVLLIGEPVAVWTRVENEMLPGSVPGSWESPSRGTGTLESDAETADWSLVLRLKAIDRTKGEKWKPSDQP